METSDYILRAWFEWMQTLLLCVGFMQMLTCFYFPFLFHRQLQNSSGAVPEEALASHQSFQATAPDSQKQQRPGRRRGEATETQRLEDLLSVCSSMFPEYCGHFLFECHRDRPCLSKAQVFPETRKGH